MNKFSIDESKCAGCGACLSFCPFGAISIGEDGKAKIDKVKCKGCSRCVKACPFDAIIKEEKF